MIVGHQMRASCCPWVTQFAISSFILLKILTVISNMGMVRDHYPKLGFVLAEIRDDGSSRSVLDLPTFVPASTFIEVTEG
jgi:hypothetical protein